MFVQGLLTFLIFVGVCCFAYKIVFKKDESEPTTLEEKEARLKELKSQKEVLE